ncbi:hypothetical protein XCR1_2950003 [Xenorhabdus cabanillasii JM26]|uniref:Uncharacterized protein n=1 Tax=Xenorhabdus cabanillasii JM26 TaxID=1427517 RepID=W1J8T6_9GAMM|nr:hypothetical protein XCR1_2950003 [Xenorhabdus cabanillasii JM26]
MTDPKTGSQIPSSLLGHEGFFGVTDDIPYPKDVQTPALPCGYHRSVCSQVSGLRTEPV